jgi:hypothetical protein
VVSNGRDRRGFVVVARLFGAAIAFTGLLVLVAGANAAGMHSTHGAACSSYGPVWLQGYNKEAAKAGNPVRILSACCHPTKAEGVNHCYVMVTLAGTRDRGCESVDIGENGLPAGQGKHENCLLHNTRQMIA